MGKTQIERGVPVITKPSAISKSVYKAFGPLEKLAAQALEKVGNLQIIDDDLVPSRR